MRILDLREVTVPIASSIANAYIDFSKMTLSLVALVTDVVRDGRRVVGYGFNSNGRYGEGGLIRERFAPRLAAADPKSLAERHGRRAEPRVFVYAAGGYYYPGKGIEQLRAEMRSYLDRGYNVVKMKIGNSIAEDRPRIEGVLAEIDGKAQLAVDANGRLTLADAIAYAKMLRDYPLFWYEEAGDPLDFALQATLADFYPGPMATGENLFSHQDARNLLRYGGMRPDRDWLQFDCALSYGLCEYQRTLAVVEAAGWSPRRCIPHGGHQMSLNIAAGLGLGGNESYPDLFQPYGGFPDGVRVEAGHIVMPELPGIGFEGKSDLIKVMRDLAA